jgi:hypothetical protein
MTNYMTYSPKKVKCANPSCDRMIHLISSLQKFCSAKCHVAVKGYPKRKKVARIAPRCEKRAAEEREYSRERKKFLEENPRCAVYPYRQATEIHHKKGRIGKLLLDKDFWLPVSREGHNAIENNPDWARQMGYTLNRFNKK